jgi:hypothetical protein
MIPLLGFSPDADPATPGIITDCTNFIPCLNGMEGGPEPITPGGVPALAAACTGAVVATNLAGVRRVLAGTAVGMYELSGGVWTDVTRASPYTSGSDSRWSFAQFGDSVLAANRLDAMQRSTGSGVDFADIASAPKAEIIFPVGSQVMALNVNDGAEKPDGWHCCAINDDTDWTTSLTTQAASGRLVSSPGAITAGAKLGAAAVAYKAKSIYIGRYVGTPSVWDWEQVAGGDAGCVGKNALCDLGGVHFVVGEDNVWLFDGTRPTPLADNQVRNWLYENSSPQYRYRTQCIFDKKNDRVWVFFPSVSSEVCDRALVYHIKTKQWGRSDRTIEAVLNYVSPGVTFDTWDSFGATFDTLPDVSYDSPFWSASNQSLAAFNSSHQLQLLTEVSATSSFTTGDIGDDEADSLLTGARLRFAPGYRPTTATMQTYHKADSSDDYITGPSASLTNGKFDVMVEDRWHKATFSFTGRVRVTAGAGMTMAAGSR